jgi:hypothetical protein
MRRTIAVLLFLLAFPVRAGVIQLKEGVNQIDLDGDGVKDLVIKTDRFNGTAHGYMMYSFALARDGRYQSVAFEDSFAIQERPDADCNESLFQLGITNGVATARLAYLRAPYFIEDEGYAAPRDAGVRTYELSVDKEYGEHKWKLTDEKRYSGEYCELERLF